MAENKNKVEDQDPFAGFKILDPGIQMNPDDNIPKMDIKDDEDLEIEDGGEPPIDPEPEPEPTPQPEPEPGDEVSPFKAFASHFGKKGLLDFDEESFDDSEEGLEQVVTSTIENRVKAEVGEFFNSMPDELKLMAEFVANGGDPRQFIDVYYNNKSFAELDATDENNQKLLVSKFLEATGYEQDEINEAIADYEYSGILEKEAKRAQGKLAKAEEDQKKQLVIEQQKAKEAQAKAYQDYLGNLKQDLEKREDIKGFKVSPSLKTKLYDHITKPVTKDGKTQLMVNHEKNPDAQLVYAYLDLIGWDISKLEKQVQTKVTSNLKANLGRFTDSKAKVSKGTTEPSLPQDFSAFKNFKL